MSKINRFLLLSSFFAVSLMHATTNVDATTRMAPVRSSINDFMLSTHGYGYNNPEALHKMACLAHKRAQNEVNKSWLFDEIALFFAMLWEELTGHFFNYDQSSSNDATNAVADPITDPATPEHLVETTSEPITTEVFTEYTPVDVAYADEFLEEQEIIIDEEILAAEETINSEEEAAEEESAAEFNYQDSITTINIEAKADEEEIALENLIELEQAMFDYLQETNSMVEEITSATGTGTEEESDLSFEDDFDSLLYHIDNETIEIIIQDMIASFFQPYEYDEEINRATTHKEVVEKARKVIFAIRSAARIRNA